MKTARKISREDLPNDALFRILSRCKESDGGCFNWSGATSKKDGAGYGRITLNNTAYGCHRVVWTLLKGGIPDKKILCHKCDNPLCCNVNHMFIGTQADNVRDMVKKGRDRKNPYRGGNHSRAALSNDQAKYIRDNYIKYDPVFGIRPMAKEFGVSETCLYRVVSGKRYKF